MKRVTVTFHEDIHRGRVCRRQRRSGSARTRLRDAVHTITPRKRRTSRPGLGCAARGRLDVQKPSTTERPSTSSKIDDDALGDATELTMSGRAGAPRNADLGAELQAAIAAHSTEHAREERRHSHRAAFISTSIFSMKAPRIEITVSHLVTCTTFFSFFGRPPSLPLSADRNPQQSPRGARTGAT